MPRVTSFLRRCRCGPCPRAIIRVRELFEAEPDLAAVFGSYDAAPAAPDLISQYRNLLKLQTKATDVVAGSMPHWVYLRTGLKAVMPPYEPDPAKAQHLLDSVPVKYLIVDEELAIDTRRYTYPVVRSFPAGWKRVYSASVTSEFGNERKDRFEIYERVDSQTTSAAAYR